MSKYLFNEFNPVSTKAWKQKIQLDLKGADYNSNLIWKSNEGIDIKPFYHSEDTTSISFDIKMPKHWNIGETIFVQNEFEANKKAHYALSKGVEKLKFIIPNSNLLIKDIISNIDTNSTPVYLELDFLDENYVLKNNEANKKGNVNHNTDIIGNLVKTGNWYSNLEKDHKSFESIIKATSNFGVNISTYQNAGANITQQLAYGLAHCNEYLNHINNTDLLRDIFNTNGSQKLIININVAIGTNYFFEIAKLRTLRLLFSQLILDYNLNAQCQIIACPTKRNKTLYDYNTNMLRTTTECMSAILGGANTIINSPYDAIYHKDNEFGSRISRNQLLILKHESYFNQVNNATDGTYYIESLTSQFAEKALNLFKKIEAKGGFVSQLFEGTIQRKIKESAQKEQNQFDNSDEILLGTNKYPNLNDKMKHELELYPFIKTNIRKTLIEPIIEKRLSETIEKERLENEKN